VSQGPAPGPALPGHPVAGTPSITATGLVTLIVGETARSSSSRGRSRRPAAAGDVGVGVGAPEGSPPPGPWQWSCQWTDDGPGTLAQGGGAEADLTLTLSPDDARSVHHGELAPSVAFMQGRLKTAGDNALLLRVLAWTATPDFEASLAEWAKEHGS